MVEKTAYETLKRRIRELEQEATLHKHPEEALRKSESRYRTLLDFVPYPMVVFSMDGLVSYLNPSFTEIFGWTLDELEGKKIPYVPPELQQETSEKIKELFEEKIIRRYDTKRLTKSGRVLDVIVRGAVLSEPQGELVILRDITQERRIALHKEAMHAISMALPEYPELDDLLDYISSEIKSLLRAESGVVILIDEENQELFFPGVSNDDSAIQKRVKGVRFPIEQMDQVVAEKVIKTGEPIIVTDTTKVPKSYPMRDKKLGYRPKNFLQVPLRNGDRIIGALAAVNKQGETFDQTDVELLSMIAGTVALSVENARSSEQLKKAYQELTSLDRAKDKVINHLSHELKTPVSVLDGSLDVLAKKLAKMPQNTWKRTMDRAKRNVNRLREIQEETDDIMRDKQYKSYDLLSQMLDQCKVELETLIADEVGEGPIVERLRNRIEEMFGPKEIAQDEIFLGEFVGKRIRDLKALFSHRQIEIISHFDVTPSVYMPPDVLRKTVDGLIKNAVENTPDEGKVEVTVRTHGEGSELVVCDYGVGITEENRGRIFEGFITTQGTEDYSSKRPFDFNAGGKGADLLRMKIFSERFNFRIQMASLRCQFIPKAGDVCPGRISDCHYCMKKEDCHLSGWTTFSINFPAVSERGMQSG